MSLFYYCSLLYYDVQGADFLESHTVGLSVRDFEETAGLRKICGELRRRVDEIEIVKISAIIFSFSHCLFESRRSCFPHGVRVIWFSMKLIIPEANRCLN